MFCLSDDAKEIYTNDFDSYLMAQYLFSPKNNEITFNPVNKKNLLCELHQETEKSKHLTDLTRPIAAGLRQGHKFLFRG